MAGPLLTPRLLASLGDLQISSRRIAENLRSGLQRSRQPGAAREFANHRHYQPGDDPRQLDWKLYARSDRYYVRESEVERSRSVRLMVDASESLAHEEHGVSKWSVARVFAAALAYIAHAQGDPVGLDLINDRQSVHLPPARSSFVLPRIFHALETALPAGHWPSAGSPATAEGEIIFFLTDGHELHDEIQQSLRHLASRRHEITVILLTAPREEAFAYAGNVLLEDLESKQTREIEAASVRTDFLRERDRHRTAFSQVMARLGVQVFPHRIDQPLDRALRSLLRAAP